MLEIASAQTTATVTYSFERPIGSSHHIFLQDIDHLEFALVEFFDIGNNIINPSNFGVNEISTLYTPNVTQSSTYIRFDSSNNSDTSEPLIEIVPNTLISSVRFTGFGTSSNTTLEVYLSHNSLAKQVLNSPNIKLATRHSDPQHPTDNATAKKNIVDTANGLKAKRSCYGNAPCGSVYLNENMLAGIIAVANSYKIGISEIAGGSHSKNSAHYKGRAFDINVINGTRVQDQQKSKSVKKVMSICTAAGATLVLGPTNDPKGHYNHVHCQW